MLPKRITNLLLLVLFHRITLIRASRHAYRVDGNRRRPFTFLLPNILSNAPIPISDSFKKNLSKSNHENDVVKLDKIGKKASFSNIYQYWQHTQRIISVGKARAKSTPFHGQEVLEHVRVPTCLFARGGDTSFQSSNHRNTNSNRKASPWEVGNINGNKRIAQQYHHNSSSKSIKMYMACLGVVLIWIVTGTVFYSKYNDWPIPQSFFYAVDAGMSIGFCTDVAETTIGSRAFTIIYIILGASCVGGALFLFIKDIMMEGLVVMRNEQYESLLARHAIMRLNDDDNIEDYMNQNEMMREKEAPSTSRFSSSSPLDITKQKKQLSYKQFRKILEEWTSQSLDDEIFDRLCRRKFDPLQKGYIQSEAFLQRCHEDVHSLLCTTGPLYSDQWMVRKVAQIMNETKQIWESKHRIFAVLFVWVSMGVTWGVKRQGWDVITATHFAISALATGGLTGPEVNKYGILPPEPAIFCGIFCLFGIPLFALTLGHFARVLVEEYVSAVEEKMVRESIAQPLQVTEFEYAKHICTPEDPVIHLSDFIVLQLMRQNKVDSKLVELIKAQFEALDIDKTGMLHLEQATRCRGDARKKNVKTKSSDEPIRNGSLPIIEHCHELDLQPKNEFNRETSLIEDLFLLNTLFVLALQSKSKI